MATNSVPKVSLGIVATTVLVLVFASACGAPAVTVSTPGVEVATPGGTVTARAPAVTVATPVPAAPPPVVTSTPVEERWMHLPIRIQYPSGGSRLDDQARAMLREAHSSVAHRTDIIRVRVEGHADGGGSSEANERLGLERAQGVVDFLVGEMGLPRELFEVQSFGEERPLTSETDHRDRLVNRRVEFSILVRRQAAY